jgi:glycosidase
LSQFTTPAFLYSSNIYSVNVRQYTEAGTFTAFAEHLPRLKDMGVHILWFMPIHPIGIINRKGTLGSYYSIKDFKGVNPEYGSLSDFKNLVEQAHALGMKEI